MKWNGNDTEVLTYSAIGTLALAKLSGFTLASVVPFMPIVGIGAIGLGSIYGVYRIATRDEREHKESIENQRETWIEFFEGAGIKNKEGVVPILVEIFETSNGHIYSFINPIGLSTRDYDNKDIAIKEFLDCKNILFEVKNDFLNINTIEVSLPKFVPFVLPERKSDDLIVELGVNELGERVKINFSKIHSWLVAGATGSGKSVCVHNILTQLYCNYSYNTEFYICDMKTTELNNYRDLKATIKYTDNVNEVNEIITELLKICNERHSLFTKYKVKNLQQYNKKVSKKDQLPNIVLCIEECVRLMGNKELQAKIAELCFIARSAGIIVLMTIQRCTKSLFSQDIKASLLGKIGFKTVSRINSQVIMDDDRLFKIKERGECCVSCEDISVGETNVKVMYLQEDKIDKILKQNCEYK